jgi:acyl-CoA synthetase (AMP-forming)/AMP-acid ligase II
MFVDLALGPLSEPMTGRHWDRDAVRMRHRQRVGFYARRGMKRGDRVFLCYGNTPEFFVDLAAVWSLGACAIPIDTRLTAFEIDTLGRAAGRAGRCGAARQTRRWRRRWQRSASATSTRARPTPRPRARRCRPVRWSGSTTTR